MTRAKALIATLPLQSNYGGILQAFAMQRLLKDRGISAVTDSRDYMRTTARSIAGMVKRSLLNGTTDWAVPMSVRNQRNANLRGFVAANINRIDPVPRRDMRRFLANGVSLGVAGSDQIWRPAYTNVWRNLFDAPGGESLHKVAYAGSFGLPDLREFSGRDRKRFGELLGRFSAVSVREISAAAILADEFGIDSTVVLDPTLVVDKRVWEDIAGTADTPRRNGYLAYMILDPREDLRRAANECADNQGLDLHDFYPQPITSRRAFKNDPLKFTMPPVESWLKTIRDADLVVTDSFHVCVFSMIFERPFVCLRNRARGAARFDSLEELLGIDGAFVENPSQIADARLEGIDDSRYDRIAEMRMVSTKFLDESLIQ